MNELTRAYFQQIKREKVSHVLDEYIETVALEESKYTQFVKERMKQIKGGFNSLSKKEKKDFFKECGKQWKQKKEGKEEVKEESYDSDKKKKKKPLEELLKKDPYKDFFKKTLKKFGVSSPDELDKKKRKEFFDYVDKNWQADKETD